MMNTNKTGIMPLLLILVTLLTSTTSYSDLTDEWPLEPTKYDSRPVDNPTCKTEVVPFCTSGLKPGFIPVLGDQDDVFVYLMSHPFDKPTSADKGYNKANKNKKYDDPDHYVSTHYALGFHHVPSGLNMTLEWYGLHQEIRCAAPADVGKFPYVWCNQGAVCMSMGINEVDWKEHGSISKISDITGKQFNELANWTLSYNVSYPFYSPWTLMESKGGKTWFEPMDHTTFVNGAIQKLKEAGAIFDVSVTYPYYTLVIYSNKTPVPQNYTSALPKFYSYLGGFKTLDNFVNSWMKGLDVKAHFFLEPTFYEFYNDQYWKLSLDNSLLAKQFEVVKNIFPLP